MARLSFTGGVRATCASFLSDLSPSAGLSTNESKIGSAARSAVPSVFEALEDRRLLSSVTLSGGVLKLVANNTYTNLSVTASGSSLIAKAGSSSKTVSTSSVSKIYIDGGKSGDRITIASNVYKPSYVIAGGGNDTVAGGSGRDTLLGEDGNDRIAGFSGDDKLYGGSGNDSLHGGSDDDIVDGQSGTDVHDYNGNGGLSNSVSSSTPTQPISGDTAPSSSDITLSGGVLKIIGNNTSSNLSVTASGSNLIATKNGSSRTFSTSSVSRIYIDGGSSGDRITITSNVYKPAHVIAGGGNDTVIGGSGNDTLYGEAGSDKIAGFSGNDKLYGGDGNDSLYGGAGDEDGSGGSGSNYYDWFGNGGLSNGSTSSSPTPTPSPTSPGSTPADSGVGTSPTPRITALASSVPAGHAIHVHAMGSTLGSGDPNDARYVWNFGDSSGRYNTLVGFNAAHIYNNPGNYTVSLTVTNANGRTATTRKTVNITSASRRLIYVSSSGSDSNDGSSSRPVRSFSKASALVRDNTEIRFRRGDTFSVYAGMQINETNVVVGAYGSGSKPVLKWAAGMPDKWPEFILTYSATNVKVEGLTFDTPFGGTDKTRLTAVRFGGKNISVVGNEFRNIDEGTNGNSNPQGILVQDNSAPLTTGLRGGLGWASGKDLVYIGNFVANSTRENVLRVSTELEADAPAPERILIAHNNLTNLDRSNVDRSDYLKGSIVVQKSKYIYITGNTVRDGWITVGPLGNNDGLIDKGGRTYWAVVEGNKVFDTSVRVQHGAEHVMVRNNIVDRDDQESITVEGYNSTYGRGVKDVTIVNNTGYMRGRAGSFLRVNGPVQGIALANNLFVSPNMETGVGGSASVYVGDRSLNSFNQITNNVWGMPMIHAYAQGGINYIYDYWSNSAGYKTPTEWNSYAAVETDYFTDVSVGSNYAPSSSSYAASSANKYAGVFADFYGKMRPTSGIAIGAVEV